MTESNLPSDQRVLFELKSRGPQAAAALGQLLGMTAMGARKQLLRLEDETLVRSYAEAGGVGRPRRVFELTQAGHARFPDTHSQLTVELLGSVQKLFGDDGVDALIAERERASRESYQREVGRHRSLQRRVQALAEIRTREGYMAEWWREGPGRYVLVENHCPVCAAARACQELCRAELNLFRTVLGDDVTVTRSEHLLAGARRCAYEIAKAKVP